MTKKWSKTTPAEAATSMWDAVHFEVNGRPVAWKRPAQTREGVRYDSQVDAKAAFSIKALKSIYVTDPNTYPSPKPLIHHGPVAVVFRFVFERRTPDENVESLPDLDNLVKFALDAMQSQSLDGVIWTDDSQVVNLAATKEFGPKDGTYVHVVKL